MIKDNRLEFLKWRWEFMRRNREYIADYKALQKRRKEIKDDPESLKQVERSFAEKWFPGCAWYSYDPSKSFEEIIEIIHGGHFRDAEDVKKFLQKDLKRWAFGFALDNHAVTVLETISFGNMKGIQNLNLDDLTSADLLLRVNFQKVNSLTALKELVCDLLEERFNRPALEIDKIEATEINGEEAHLVHFRPSQQKKRQIYAVKYDTIIEVGDLKEKDKLTNQKIAKQLKPEAFKDTDDEIASPESKIRLVSYYYKRYKELVNGGYKNITYP